MQPQHQFSVQDTNQEALASKLSAVKKGYFKDVYAEEFVNFRGKRDIIIHRGYWARVYIVRKIVESIISNSSQVQIVSLGCGLETLWFNLADQGLLKDKRVNFVEIDLTNVVHKKINKIEKSQKINDLFKKLGESLQISGDKDSLSYGNMYKLISCDLTNLKHFEQVLISSGIKRNIPTLFYSQCVLSYIQSSYVDSLLGWISSNFDLSFVFDYEMFNPDDRFGQMMMKNFEERGCPLVGIRKYPLLKDQETRFSLAGFKKTQVHTMSEIYYHYIDKADRMQIQKIEMLDQLEEWNIIMGHYFGLLSANWNQNGELLPQFKILTQKMRFK